MDDGLRLGFGLPVSGSWATPDVMARVAQAADEAGYASLWAFQRLLHPVDGNWGPMYRSVHDPLIALAHVASRTHRARLGVAVLNMPFFAPILAAKQLATLDAVTGGRLDVGLGLGWAPEEFASVGVPMEGRGKRADEFIACLKALWGPDPVHFDGRLYRVPISEVQPKPLQTPHPPLLLGGSAEPALRRVGRVADGWVSASRHDLTDIARAIGVIRDAATAAGRDPSNLRFVVRGVVSLGQELTSRSGGRRPLTGTAEQIRDDVRALSAQGVTEVFLDPNFDPSIGTPDADAVDAERRAMHLLETFAPAA